MTKREKDLLLDYKEARRVQEKCTENLKEANKKLYATEAALLEHLEYIGAEKTATYEGIGYVSRSKPRLYARCNKEDERYLFQFLNDIGRSEIIKESVHGSSLSSLVAERIETGDPVPDYIQYYLKPGVRMYEK